MLIFRKIIYSVFLLLNYISSCRVWPLACCKLRSLQILYFNLLALSHLGICFTLLKCFILASFHWIRLAFTVCKVIREESLKGPMLTIIASVFPSKSFTCSSLLFQISWFILSMFLQRIKWGSRHILLHVVSFSPFEIIEEFLLSPFLFWSPVSNVCLWQVVMPVWGGCVFCL